MTQKGFVKIILVLVIIVLLGIVGYFALVKKSLPIAQQTSTPTPTLTKTSTPTLMTTDWKIYVNKEYNFQLTFTDAWAGYRVYREQWFNVHAVSYIFAVPTKDKTFSDTGVPPGYYKAFVLILLDKKATKPWDENGPHPKYLKSSQTMDFYVSYPQEIPRDLEGKIDAVQVVNSLKLLP
jgi:hypothetical protein